VLTTTVHPTATLALTTQSVYNVSVPPTAHRLL
jgi:hypothetical protein